MEHSEVAIVIAVISVLIAVFFFKKMISKSRKIHPKGKAVLVTGCSSGIGRGIATYLSGNGFVVFATVRKQSDADSLVSENKEFLIPVCPLDLTNRDQIIEAGKFVQQELQRRNLELWAVVNNAGGGGLCPMEVMDAGYFRREFETRVFGPLELLKQLLPSIRKSHGRVLWTVVAGLMPLPFVGSIHVPEWSTQCLASTLDMELHPWGIQSIKIGCGMIESAAPEKGYKDLQNMLATWDQNALGLYGSKMELAKDELQAMDSTRTPAIEVGKTVFLALTQPKPAATYRIGKLSTVSFLMEFAPYSLIKSILLRKWKL